MGSRATFQIGPRPARVDYPLLYGTQVASIMSDIPVQFPKLLLLPGMDGTSGLFGRFVDALPAEFDATTVRYPGDRAQSLADLVPLVLSECPASAPFVLLAESYSTPLAIQIAASRAPNLIGLVLCAGFALSPVQGWKRIALQVLAPALFRIGLPKTVAERWLVGPGAPPPLVEEVRSAVKSVKPEVLVARIRETLECDVRAELAQVHVPILYIMAKNDRLVGASCAAEIRRIDPSVGLAEIEGPHLLLQREPQKSAEIVVSFVRRLA